MDLRKLVIAISTVASFLVSVGNGVMAIAQALKPPQSSAVVVASDDTPSPPTPLAKDASTDKILADLLDKPPQSNAGLLAYSYIPVAGRIDQSFVWQATKWHERPSQARQLDGRVRTLIERGSAVVPAVHLRLKELNPDHGAVESLVFVLHETGNRESIPVLINLFERASLVRPDGAGAQIWQSHSTSIACTAALWRLTGRPHPYSARDWDHWWDRVERDFVLPSKRDQHQAQAERVKQLSDDLATDEPTARERLIVSGRSVIPELLSRASKVDAQRQIAWVIDELEEAKRLTVEIRNAYYIERFSMPARDQDWHPMEIAARRRAVESCRFADFCRIAQEVERRTNNDPSGLHLWGWIKMNPAFFTEKFAARSEFDLPSRSLDQPQTITPVADPAAEVAAAVPVVIEGLNDSSRSARLVSAHLAAVIGMSTKERPVKLVAALRDAWLREQDDFTRLDLGLAMSRFPIPTTHEAVIQGLASDRALILGDAASFVSWAEMKPARFPAVYDRLVELTEHQDDRVRHNAARSLRYEASARLLPRIELLMADPNPELRMEAIYAVADHPDEKYSDLLFKQLADPSEQLRIRAVDTLGNPAYRKSLTRFLPYLRDKKIHGYVVHSLAKAGGQDAVPLMMDELKQGNDVGGMVYQHLRTLTGQTFDTKPEPWLEWWNSRKGP